MDRATADWHVSLSDFFSFSDAGAVDIRLPPGAEAAWRLLGRVECGFLLVSSEMDSPVQKRTFVAELCRATAQPLDLSLLICGDEAEDDANADASTRIKPLFKRFCIVASEILCNVLRACNANLRCLFIVFGNKLGVPFQPTTATADTVEEEVGRVILQNDILRLLHTACVNKDDVILNLDIALEVFEHQQHQQPQLDFLFFSLQQRNCQNDAVEDESDSRSRFRVTQHDSFLPLHRNSSVSWLSFERLDGQETNLVSFSVYGLIDSQSVCHHASVLVSRSPSPSLSLQIH